VASSELDYAQFEKNDAWIKIWLPPKLIQALDLLSAAHDSSRPDVLRGLLFEHVYGRQELEGLIAWKRRRDGDDGRMLREPGQEYEFAPPRIASIDMFGKATEDIKLWLPKRLKDDITALANNAGMGISDYIRKTLVRILLGEKTHQQWQAAIGNVPADIRRAEAEEGV
jgi:hypothetical protein